MLRKASSFERLLLFFAYSVAWGCNSSSLFPQHDPYCPDPCLITLPSSPLSRWSYPTSHPFSTGGIVVAHNFQLIESASLLQATKKSSPFPSPLRVPNDGITTFVSIHRYHSVVFDFIFSSLIQLLVKTSHVPIHHDGYPANSSRAKLPGSY